MRFFVTSIAIPMLSSIAAAAPIPMSSTTSLPVSYNTSLPNDPALTPVNITDLPPATGLPVSHKTAQPNDTALTPVNILDLADGATMTCGSTTLQYKDIFDSVKWATLLKMKGVGRGKKSSWYPNGRFPHDFPDKSFTFNDHCSADEYRLEYPVLLGDVYNGGISTNDKWGDHRVVFLRQA